MSKPSSSSHKSPSHSKSHPQAQPQFDFLCKPKFTNTLPDLPFDGKFLACPFVPVSRFIDYKPSMLEKDYNFEVQCEMDMGIDIDLVDPETYKVTEGRRVPIDPKDQYLLEDESESDLNSKRSAQHSKVVPWMRKTEYISSEFNRFGVSADRQEVKVGYNLTKKLDNENLYRDRQSQIDAINKTFEDVKKPVRKHYSKKGVEAVEELTIFPDFELWKYPFAQVIFDADPSYSGVPESLQRTAMEQSLIKGLQSAEGEQYVGYFSPTVETIQKRMEDKEAGRHYEEDHAYEYGINREYTWNVKNKASKGFDQDTYFLYPKDGSMYYNELETRVKLNRRRRPAGQPKPNTRLLVTNRDATEAELALMTERLQSLLHPDEGKEEEEEEEEMDHDRAGDDKKSEKSGSEDSDSDNGAARSEKSSGKSDESGDDSEKESSSSGSDSDEDDKKSSSS